MSEWSTGAMTQIPDPAQERDGTPGLVLLWAEPATALPGAFPLTRTRVVLGRDGDVALPVAAVSRRHAELELGPRGWLIRDLGSRNGTFVDCQRIHEAPLEPGAELRIGDAFFKLVDGDALAYSNYRLDGVTAKPRRCPVPSALLGGYQMDRIAAELARVAPSDLSVLVRGETGAGKEVVAAELHRLGGRRGRYVAINCAAVPPHLLESELFGHKRGAFSGADRDKPGLVQAADDGTLLLDEIGDMPLEAQAKLLRMLQTKEVLPLGATVPTAVNVRVVCATHRDLLALQRDGRFRPDLYARLAQHEVTVPPLRERKEDILQLVLAFLQRLGRSELRLDGPFMMALVHHDWPYNVRELESCIQRSVVLATTPVLGAAQLPEQIRDAMIEFGRARSPSVPPPAFGTTSAGPPTARAPEPFDRCPSEPELRAMLAAHGGNVAAVGRDLGKARMQIHRWMRRYGITVDDYR